MRGVRIRSADICKLLRDAGKLRDPPLLAAGKIKKIDSADDATRFRFKKCRVRVTD